MPFASDKQRAYLAINKPEVAHKFAMHSKKKNDSVGKNKLKKCLSPHPTAVSTARG